ncbi:hypothetical protein OH809_07960 [Streptomyces sp. NBC_00873]|uniref:hypothetical protein n=1 Tax=Streptomyces sp. NBC_00873 TaxID=2975852 RepID=UPI00386A751E|nr:hypothetical protein OH809_07960 [Streptomyces sp. NBC_00873]
MEAEFAGEFETHLTVRLGTEAGAMDASARLEHRAGRTGLKLTRIVLDRGPMPDQPMLTETGRGALTERRAAALLRSAELRAAGFPVIRVKIEASPRNADILQTADEAAALSPVCHFEHHIKLLLPGEPEVAMARAVAERHSAHLSRNARRAAREGRHERFVTQRCRTVGRPEARARLDALLGALTAATGGWTATRTGCGSGWRRRSQPCWNGQPRGDGPDRPRAVDTTTALTHAGSGGLP